MIQGSIGGPIIQNLALIQGEHTNLRFHIVDYDAADLDLTGGGVRWVLAASKGGAALVTLTITEAVTTEGTIDTPTEGKGVCKLLPSGATVSLAGLAVWAATRTEYWHSLQSKVSNEYVTVTEGQVRISVARQTAGW